MKPLATDNIRDIRTAPRPPVWALVPIKSPLQKAKQRLQALLSPNERQALALAMLRDVLACLVAHPAIDGVMVVSDDPLVRGLTEQYAIDYQTEQALGAHDLNTAVAAGLGFLAKKNIDHVVVVHGDLPMISQWDIASLLAPHQFNGLSAITVAPDHLGVGTNALLCSSVPGLVPGYGSDSCHWHSKEAERLGVEIRYANQPGLARDLDTPDDLHYLVSRRQGLQQRNLAHHTFNFLQHSGLESRILQTVSHCV